MNGGLSCEITYTGHGLSGDNIAAIVGFGVFAILLITYLLLTVFLRLRGKKWLPL